MLVSQSNITWLQFVDSIMLIFLIINFGKGEEGQGA